jgi:hypothetical protein
MNCQEIIRLGLPEFVKEVRLGSPKIALLGSTPVLV